MPHGPPGRYLTSAVSLSRVTTPGSAASHAERVAAIEDVRNGGDGNIGVSRQQCGDCRRWFREFAVRHRRTFIVADPQFTRVYYPSAEVAVYANGGGLKMVASVQPDPGHAGGTIVTFYNPAGAVTTTNSPTGLPTATEDVFENIAW